MLEEEIAELGSKEGQFGTIYFPGLIHSRTTLDI
jgi:hypothetical protein